jgi:hypothetical protein
MNNFLLISPGQWKAFFSNPRFMGGSAFSVEQISGCHVKLE